MKPLGLTRPALPSARLDGPLRFEQQVRADLLARRWLRLHAFLIAATMFAACWGLSATLMHFGVERLSVRWALSLALTYPVFVGALWLWCRWLLSRDEGDLQADGLDLSTPHGDVRGDGLPPFQSGGGGDFGGGGASASFDGGGASDVVEGAGKAFGKGLEVAFAAEEGAVVAVPLVLVVGVAVAVAAGLGIAVFGLFGIEVLLGVAVEVAFASAGGALAWRARREGWLAHSLSRTWAPMLAVLIVAAGTGAAIDRWLPQAHSLPQALRLLRG